MKENLKRLLSALVLCVLLTTGLSLPVSAAQFTDVPSNYWAADSIRRCAEAGLFQGKTATRFGVGQPMSRGSFAVVLCRLFGWEPEPAGNLPFTDVPGDAWYAPALAAALRHGAVTVQTEEFRPAEPLTREELAAALIRGLGYGPIAGLSQELPLPFTDVDTNRGYITMARDMGLVNGTTDTTFSPERIATREQCAVILMRLYDKLHGTETGRIGVITSAEELPALNGFQAVAIGKSKLISGSNPRVTNGMDENELTMVREAAEAAGTKQLLRVTGSANVLSGKRNMVPAAKAIHEAVTRGGYDGVLLDFPALEKDSLQEPLNLLTIELKELLGSSLLYVVAEAPSGTGKTYAGYDYAGLGRHADRVVLRVNSTVAEAEDMAVAPVQPLEGIYYGLRQLGGAIAPEKLTLWMSTAATVWEGTHEREALTGLEVDTLLEDPNTDRYYSKRYGCSYLLADGLAVWYPDETSARERAAMGRLFRVNQVCLSELSGMSPTVLNGLK